jgi:hypothetical protein
MRAIVRVQSMIGHGDSSGYLAYSSGITADWLLCLLDLR